MKTTILAPPLPSPTYTRENVLESLNRIKYLEVKAVKKIVKYNSTPTHMTARTEI